jgi:hypothetical protein
MEPETLWDVFCLTGEPMAYMLYRAAEQREDNGPSA